VGPVTRCDVGRRREAEANLITGLLAVPCAAGFVGAVWPAADDAIGTAVLVLLAVVVGLGALRLLARRVREWREDHADLAAAREFSRSRG
jgi:uncharacterized membrane protein